MGASCHLRARAGPVRRKLHSPDRVRTMRAHDTRTGDRHARSTSSSRPVDRPVARGRFRRDRARCDRHARVRRHAFPLPTRFYALRLRPQDLRLELQKLAREKRLRAAFVASCAAARTSVPREPAVGDRARGALRDRLLTGTLAADGMPARELRRLDRRHVRRSPMTARSYTTAEIVVGELERRLTRASPTRRTAIASWSCGSAESVRTPDTRRPPGDPAAAFVRS